MRLLIVDDKKEDLYLLETLLKGSGYEVVPARNERDVWDLSHKKIG